MKMPNKLEIIYITLLFLITIAIWRLIYNAQFLFYDDNYGSLLGAFFLSFWATVVLIIIWFKRRTIIMNCKWITILFLIYSSPFTVALVSIYYQEIFGVMLKN